MEGRTVKPSDKKGMYLPVLGKIMIGELTKKSPNGPTFPTSLDYFKVDDQCRYKNNFIEKLGEKPNKLRIAFISDRIEEVCNERWECYYNGVTRGFRFGYGDGHSFKIFDPASQKEVPILASDPQFAIKTAKWEWKVVLTLRFVILDLPGILGQWQLTTRGAKSSIPGIINTFDSVLAQAKTVRGLPFDLTISKVKGKSLSTGGDVSTTNFPVLNLVPNFTEENIRMVKEYISQGGNTSDVAILTMNFKQLSENVNHQKTIPATSSTGGAEANTTTPTTTGTGGAGGNATTISSSNPAGGTAE